MRPFKFHLSCFRSSERADDALQRREERAERSNRRHSAAQHRRAGRRLVHERHPPPAESPPAESRNPKEAFSVVSLQLKQLLVQMFLDSGSVTIVV